MIDTQLSPFARRVARSRLLDAVLRLRAADLLRKSQLDRHLPSQGLLLDLGAGLGHVAEAVRNAGQARDCLALDPVWSPPQPLVTRLHRRDGAGGIKAVCGDGRALPFRAGSFDAAWCAFVLHHLPGPAQDEVLAEAARVLRPGAPFILIEDTPAIAATARADRRLNGEDEDAPHHYRAPAAWRAVLQAHGFQVTAETAFTSVFPRVTWRAVPHRMFVCRSAQPSSLLPIDGQPNPPPG